MSCHRIILFLSFMGILLTTSAQVNFHVGETWMPGVSIDRLSFSDDGRIYYIYNDHRSIAYYDLLDGPTDLTTQFRAAGFTYFIDIITSGTTAYIAANNGQLAIFDHDTASLFHQFEAPHDSLTSVALSGMGFFLGEEQTYYTANIGVGTINGLFYLSFDGDFVYQRISNTSLYSYEGTGYAYDGSISIVRAPYYYACPANNVVSVEFSTGSYVSNIQDSLQVLDFQCKKYSPYISPRPAFYLGTDDGLIWRYWECDSYYDGHYIRNQQIYDVQFFSPFAPIASIINKPGYTMAASSDGLYHSGDESGSSDRMYTRITGTEGISFSDQTINSCAGELYAASEQGIIQIKAFENKSFIPYIADRISPVGSRTFCSRDSFEINSGFNYGFEVQWFRNNDTIPGETNYLLKTTLPGTYKYAITNCFFEEIQYSHELNLQLDETVNFTWPNPNTLYACEFTDTLTVQTDSGNQVVWFLDDEEIDRDTSSLVITSSGKYHAQVINCNGFTANSRSTEVIFTPLAKPDIALMDAVTCSGDTAKIEYSNHEEGHIEWFVDGLLIDSLANQNVIESTLDGQYQVRVYNASCEKYSDPLELTIQPKPEYTIIGDTYFCEGTPTALQFVKDQSLKLYVNEEELYFLEVSSESDLIVRVVDSVGCFIQDTVSITLSPAPPIYLPKDTAICFGEKSPWVLPDAPYNRVFLDGVHQEDAIEITYAGVFAYTLVDSLGCTRSQNLQVMDNCPDIIIPNIFTPNGDGINDSFVIQNLIPECQLSIFDHSGTLLYHTSDYQNNWKAENFSTGTYYYLLKNKFYDRDYKGYVVVMK